MKELPHLSELERVARTAMRVAKDLKNWSAEVRQRGIGNLAFQETEGSVMEGLGIQWKGIRTRRQEEKGEVYNLRADLSPLKQTLPLDMQLLEISTIA